MTALVFMDTETTGLSLDDDIWEFAAIRREADGTERELHLFLEHSSAKCSRLPDSFRADHARRFPSGCSDRITPRREACQAIASLFGEDRPHVVGAVPNFDTERLSRMIRAEWPHWPRDSFWHYHLIDVESLAVGYLYGLLSTRDGYLDSIGNYKPPTLPWDSDELSRACGVEPPTDERHTAMGDVRWATALYDAIQGGCRA